MNNYPRVVNVSNEGIRAVILPNGTASIWTEDGKEPFQHNRKIHETTALGVYTTKDAVAVLLSDNSIEVWGDPSKGGDILRNVQQEIKTYGANQVYSTGGAFAVLLGNKRVVTWGDSKLGGTIPPTIKHQIAKKEVKSVFSNDSAFIVITQDRSVYAWGDSKRGGKIPRIVQQEIETGGGILQLYSTKYAFAALLMNGQVVTWGDADYGGEIDDNSKAMIVEHGVKNIYSTDSAFAVLLGNKRVVAWGDDERGGDVNSMLEHGAVHWGYTVESIFSNKGAFVALIHIAISGGKGLLAWGDPENGGHIGDMTGSAIGNAAPIHVYATDTSFAAHLEDHRVVSWGREGRDEHIINEASVLQMFSNKKYFTAILDNNSAVSWGVEPEMGAISFEDERKIKPMLPKDEDGQGVGEDEEEELWIKQTNIGVDSNVQYVVGNSIILNTWEVFIIDDKIGLNSTRAYKIYIGHNRILNSEGLVSNLFPSEYEEGIADKIKVLLAVLRGNIITH